MQKNRDPLLPAELPLMVDLDGTLLPFDCSVILAGYAMRHDPLRFFSQLWRILPWLIWDRGSLKTWLWKTQGAALEAALPRIPWRQAVQRWLFEEQAAGRQLFLVTGSAQGVADAVAAHWGCFAAALGASPGVNLVGKTKAAALTPPFAYVGDSARDLDVWPQAEVAIGVALEAGVRRRIQIPIARLFGGPRATFRQSLAFGWRNFAA